MLSKKKTTVGFIGMGVMGTSMAGHIQAAGWPLQVYNRTRSKAEPLLEKGAAWAETPAVIAKSCDIIFTIVGYPTDVEDVYFGVDGLLTAIRSATILVDMTTSTPELAVRIADAVAEKGAVALDAPVSGGDTGARNAALSIMVGGEREAFDTVLPLLNCMGKNIVFQGGPGAGQHCKMCNQITIAANMLGVCEALAYAEKAGLDPASVLKSISAGAAGSWSLSNLAPRILSGNFAPGFYVKHFIKDMTIVTDTARAMEMDLPGLKLALKRYRELADKGFENDGTQALYRLYQKS